MLPALIVLVLLFAIGAAVALVRGLFAFSQDGDLIRGGSEPWIARAEQQNRMMALRVKYQGLAILAVAVVGVLFAGR